MGLNTTAVTRCLGVFAAIAFACADVAAQDADDKISPPSSTTTTNSSGGSELHYGLFDWLDHRSAYTQEVFPEPFLVDDMALEENELEFTWLHTKGGGPQNDSGTVEFQKGFGLLTLELQIPYERIASPDQIVHGIGNIEMGGRYPLYQFVSAGRLVDATFGAALQAGIPIQLRIDRNAELEPQAFNCLRLGEHFTAQTVLGYSTLFGSGDDGGLQSFEYGVSFGYAIPHRQLPLPGVQKFLPMFELAGETGLNKEESGRNSLEGDIGFRLNFNPIGEAQPELGLAYVFPVDSGARAELHWGFVVSLIFEF